MTTANHNYDDHTRPVTMDETDIQEKKGFSQRLRGMSRRTIVIVGVSAVVVVALVITAIGFGGSTPTAEESNSGLPPATAPIEKSDLTQTQSVSGTLAYGVPTSLQAQGNGVVTWIASTGATVTLGQPVYKVDDKPVVLIHGSTPPYRKLQSGMSGADVKQLEESLAKLGYKGFKVDDYYNSATANAVSKWQDDLGLEKTGTVDPSQIVVAGGDIRISEHGLSVGQQLATQPKEGIVTYSGTTRVVTVDLDVAKQQFVKEGNPAKITLPDGKVVQGKVATVGKVATAPAEGESTDANAKPTISVTISIDDQGALGTFDSAPVDLTLVTGEAKQVLTVPVFALIALSGGGYGVQVVDGNSVSYVGVKTGMFAEGKVEVSGDGISEGMKVGVPK